VGWHPSPRSGVMELKTKWSEAIGMRSLRRVALVAAFSGALACAASASVAAPMKGSVQIVQAVPGASVEVTLDGAEVGTALEVGTIVGPFALAPGPHTVRFVDSAGEAPVTMTVTIAAGSSTDVVLHRPASISGRPEANTYEMPTSPIGPGKARVLLAHTATVPPADVRVDGKIVFTNIANGEFADADVSAGTHEVALLPTGETGDPILGPLDVTLKEQTVTMVYAVGSPSNGSMRVIAHVSRIASDGSVVPESLDTGSAGLVADRRVSPFDSRRSGSSSGMTPWLVVGIVLVGTIAGLRAPRSPRRLSEGPNG
jgi:hypothetical protein